MKYFFLLLTFIFINTINAQSIEEFDTLINKKINQKLFLDADVLADKLKEKHGEVPEYFKFKSSINCLNDNRSLGVGFLFLGLDNYPNHFGLLLETSNLCMKSGLIDTTLSFILRAEKVCESNDDSLAIQITKGGYYLYNREFEKGILEYEEIIKNNKDCWGCYNNLFIIYFEQKNYIKALDVMYSSFTIDSTNYTTLNNLGLALSALNRHEEAIYYLDKVLIEKPESAYSRSNKAYCLLKLGNPKQALKEINYSISIDNKNSYAYRNRALIYLDLNLVNEACMEIEHGLKLGFEMYYGSELQKLKDKYCK